MILRSHGFPKRDQVALWRAAARGHERMGRDSEALLCWNQARLILGLLPRKGNANVPNKLANGS